jgi:hypothetical protein
MYVCMYCTYEKQMRLKSDSDINILMAFNSKPRWDFRDIRYSSPTRHVPEGATHFWLPDTDTRIRLESHSPQPTAWQVALIIRNPPGSQSNLEDKYSSSKLQPAPPLNQ